LYVTASYFQFLLCLMAVFQTKKLGFVPSPKVWSPALHGWMSRYKNALVSKFSLYFYEVLCRQGSVSEVKALMAKTSVDFYAKLIISLVL